MEQLLGKVNALKKEMSEREIRKAEMILYEICDQNNSQSIKLLIKLLDDDFEFDEFMFSIIHCIEKFEIHAYVHNLLKTIPESIYRSPRWASILHMRILNSPHALLAYIKEIKENATRDQKKSIEHLLDSINKVDPEFLAKTVPLLAICKM